MAESPDAELVVICDRDEERLHKVGRRYPATELITDAEKIWQDDVPAFNRMAKDKDVNALALSISEKILGRSVN